MTKLFINWLKQFKTIVWKGLFRLCLWTFGQEEGLIDSAIGRHPSERKRMSTRTKKGEVQSRVGRKLRNLMAVLSLKSFLRPVDSSDPGAPFLHGTPFWVIPCMGERGDPWALHDPVWKIVWRGWIVRPHAYDWVQSRYEQETKGIFCSPILKIWKKCWMVEVQIVEANSLLSALERERAWGEGWQKWSAPSPLPCYDKGLIPVLFIQEDALSNRVNPSRQGGESFLWNYFWYKERMNILNRIRLKLRTEPSLFRILN